MLVELVQHGIVDMDTLLARVDAGIAAGAAALPLAGLNPHAYGSHSLRSGAITSLAGTGGVVRIIQSYPRLPSNRNI